MYASPHGVVDATPTKVVEKDPIDPNALNPEDIQHIVGGDPSEAGEWPYYTLVKGCGGSLIAPRVILTAAHCRTFRYINKKIIIGPTKRYSLGNGSFQKAEERRIKEAIDHPNYNKKTYDNDYALILLDKEYIIESNINLVLNEDPNFPQAGEVLDILGMGDLASSGDLADELRDVKVKSFSNSKCNSFYGGNQIKSSMICAGYKKGKKDACQGDSGGPLVKVDGDTHTQIGVVSWGKGCAEKKYPSVYSRVSEEIDWMKQVICEEWNVEFYLCGQTTPTPPSPTPVCADSETFVWYGFGKENCEWFAKKMKKGLNFCNVSVGGFGDKKVKDFCKETCDEC